MDSHGETHYVSFLSGEGGGMGNGTTSGRVSRRAGNAANYHTWKKRVRGLRIKAQLLVAAGLFSLVLCTAFFFWSTKQAAQDVIPLEPVEKGGSDDGLAMDGFPTKIYEWQDHHFEHAFGKFMAEHGKVYSSLEGKQRRFQIFRANLTHIYLHNEQGHSYELGMNKFGDWTREEFSHMVGGYKKNPRSLQKSRLGVDMRLAEDFDLPASVDWRAKGCVTPPKDQGNCGSCWAFSTTGAVEGAWCAKTGKLISLSEQMLMDCSGYLGNNSCDGGMMDDAFTYVTDHGLCSEDTYPYEAHDDKCRETKCQSQVQVNGFYDIPVRNEYAMRAALARHGPVSIAIQADQLDFQFYKSGVFDAPCGTKLDHGVLLVGYGMDPKTRKDYFIMKNSWGKSWGDDGYMYMAQHKGKEGECGLLLSGSFPLVAGERPPR